MKDKQSIIKWDVVKKAYTGGGYNNCRLSLEEKLCILEYAENDKLLSKKVNWFLSVKILTNFFTYYPIDL